MTSLGYCSTAVLSSNDCISSHNSYTSGHGTLFLISLFRSLFLFPSKHLQLCSSCIRLYHPVHTPVAVMYTCLCHFPHFLKVLGSISLSLSSAYSCHNSWWFKYLCRWLFSNIWASHLEFLSSSHHVFCTTSAIHPMVIFCSCSLPVSISSSPLSDHHLTIFPAHLLKNSD